MWHPSYWCCGASLILAACTRQQETLRNNSCLVYTTPSGSNSYGIMKKDIVCESGTTCQAFAVVVPLIPAGVTLCSDTVTNAQLDSHLVTLHSPRQVYRFSMTLLRYTLTACMQELFRPKLYVLCGDYNRKECQRHHFSIHCMVHICNIATVQLPPFNWVVNKCCTCLQCACCM